MRSTVTVWRSDLAVPARHARREMLGRGLCPACIADLDGDRIDDDGLTTCTDCAARWRYAIEAEGG